MPKTGEKISTLGFGAGNLREATDSEIYNIFCYGIEQGMNIMDTVSVEETFTKPVKEAIKEVRDDLYIQMHLGGVYINGEYKKSREIDCIKKSFNNDLKKYGTDYADFGILHAVDEISDYEYIMNNGCFDYALQLKDEGYVNHVGISSHNIETAMKFVENENIDIIMLSLNPSFDFEFVDGTLQLSKKRRDFYKTCEKNNVAITVMKAFGGGKLLNKNLSSLSQELTTSQCIQYALDCPGVLSVLSGITSLNQLKKDLEYYKSSNKDKDYTFIADLSNDYVIDECIYCNHCLPCSSNIHIGLVNKLYDLIKIGDKIALEHYKNLDKHASDCIFCGQCENVCPFHVKIMDKMKEIKEYCKI